MVSKRELKGSLVVVVASDSRKKSARLTVVGRGGVSQRIKPDDHGIDTHTGRRNTALRSTIDAVVSLRHSHAWKDNDAPPAIECD